MILNAARALIGPDLALVEPGTVAVEGNRIAAVGDAASEREVVELPELTLLPGFIDGHVHIGFFDPSTVLTGGVTGVRDLAWPPEVIYPLADASQEEGWPGPLIRCVGPMLTTRGGYPTRAAWAPKGTGFVVDSATGAAEVVEQQARRGAVAIKVALNAQVGPTLDADTLRSICDAAHDKGLRVTAHIYGLTELAKGLAAGIDELAHVLMSPEAIPDEVIQQMVEEKVVCVPTLAIFGDDDRRRAIENVARFVEAGGEVLYGTDLGNEGPQPGIDRTEIEAMTATGLDGRAVIASATTTPGRSIPGFENKGVLEVGFDADIIGVRGDPLARPADLCDVAFVMREGRVIVGPAREP